MRIICNPQSDFMNNFDFNFLQPIKLFLLIQIIYYRKLSIKVLPNHTTVDEKIINNWGLHIGLQKGIRKQISVAYYIIPSLISLQVKKWHNTYSIFSNPQLDFIDNFRILNKIFNCLKIIRKKSETEMKRIYWYQMIN